MRKLLLSILILAAFTLSYIPHALADDMATSSAPLATLSDGESAEVIVTLNEGEIDLGQLAKRKANNKRVKDFAKMMVDQHKQNEKDTKRVVRKQDLDFKKTDMSKSFEAQAIDMEKTLKKIAKEDFDHTYMDQQISMHEKALNTVNSLIASAQNAAYKAHLEKTRDVITVHLAHAKEINSMIKLPVADARTGTIMQQTAPSEITTVNPMDPIGDSRRVTDSEMLDIRRRRAKAPPPVSATVEPRVTPQGY